MISFNLDANFSKFKKKKETGIIFINILTFKGKVGQYFFPGTDA